MIISFNISLLCYIHRDELPPALLLLECRITPHDFAATKMNKSRPTSCNADRILQAARRRTTAMFLVGQLPAMFFISRAVRRVVVETKTSVNDGENAGTDATHLLGVC